MAAFPSVHVSLETRPDVERERVANSGSALALDYSFRAVRVNQQSLELLNDDDGNRTKSCGGVLLGYG